MTPSDLINQYDKCLIDFPKMSDEIKKICDCEVLGSPIHTDDLGCMVKPCVLCQKKWFCCGSCKQEDFETEEELLEHFNEKHFEEIDAPMFGPDGDSEND